MKTLCYQYDVNAIINLTKDEIDYLMTVAASHYDYKCRDTTIAGPNGFIYGWNTRCTYSGDKEIEVSVSWNQLDTLCKIIEMSMDDTKLELVIEIRDTFKALRNKWAEINR